MRTAILLSGILISDSIKIIEHTEKAVAFLSIVVILCIIMDVCEFIKKMKE